MFINKIFFKSVMSNNLFSERVENKDVISITFQIFLHRKKDIDTFNIDIYSICSYLFVKLNTEMDSFPSNSLSEAIYSMYHQCIHYTFDFFKE